MFIQLNTDHHFSGRQALADEAEGLLESSLRHFTDQITRVEVHLADENSQKHGPNDKRCVMEARVTGHQPVAVTHHAETISLAMDGAAEKLKGALDATLGRLHRH